MRFRRILATAAVAAVTTPLALLSVTPAFADAKPATQEQLSGPSIKQLIKAAEDAQKAYNAAVKAVQDGRDALKALSTDASPLYVARQAAAKEAAEAAIAKGAADSALITAKATLADLPETATDAEKAAATKAVTDAEAAATKAAEAKTAADAKAVTTQGVLDDARVAAAQKIGLANQAAKSALAVKEAADKALADALDEDEEGNEGDGCLSDPDFTAVATGLPGTVVAGKWVNFKLRVTNGTEQTMDKVILEGGTDASDKSGLKDLSHLLKLQWSAENSKSWQNADVDTYITGIAPLKAGAHSDIKLRLKVDAKAPAGLGEAYFDGVYYNDKSCGYLADRNTYEFKIATAGTKPGKTPDAKPSTSASPSAASPSPQGSSAPLPTNGTLATTGSNSAVPQIALAGAAAVVVGAGAVFVVRRRKSNSAA